MAASSLQRRGFAARCFSEQLNGAVVALKTAHQSSECKALRKEKGPSTVLLLHWKQLRRRLYATGRLRIIPGTIWMCTADRNWTNVGFLKVEQTLTADLRHAF
jgi:hypothetical protein